MEDNKFIEAVGRRKSATARVRISNGVGDKFVVNTISIKDYFPTSQLVQKALSPLEDSHTKYNVSVVVSGGGVNAQSEAIRHGLTRAIVSDNIEQKKHFRDLGFLKRDPRKKERKKFGLKKARKAPQWSKR